MEELVKTLTEIKKEDIEKMLEVYEDLPPGILKQSMEITFSSWEYLKRYLEKKEKEK